jgi:hypothetical protein
MDLTLELLLESVRQYNQMLYPAQWVAIAIALACIVFAFIRKPFSNALITGSAVLFFLIIALAFWLPLSLSGFDTGFIYTGIFLMQAGLLLSAALEDELHFHFEPKLVPIIGLVFAAYGLIGFPLVGLLLGRTYPGLFFSPLAPCSMISWFVGMLLLTDRPVPRYTMIIPFTWGLVGILWVSMGVTESIGQIVIGLTGPAILCIRDREKRMGMHY